MKRPFNTNRNRGFTLVELLVVVLIIVILATVVMFAMFAATESARVARTKSMVARINDLLVPIWESYRTRRVPINIPVGTSPQAAAKMRLDAIRELMRMEIPERKSDVEDNPVVIAARPALSSAYHRAVLARANGGNYAGWTEANQGSECLYMILSRIQDGNTNGLEFVKETEIGDVDNDGMPEILDGWRKPIAFLRWAPGFIPANGAVTAIQDGTSPDPFDPMNVYPGTFELRPLIFSAGPDRTFDIEAASGFQYSQTAPNKNDPFDTDNSTPAIGTPNTAGGQFADNISNHLLSTATE